MQVTDEMVEAAVETYAANDPLGMLMDGAAFHAALTAALAKAWRPIESAPRDGRRFFARRDNGYEFDYYVVRWSVYDTEYPWQAEFNSYAEHRLDEWMPLPAPPATKGAGHV